VAVAKVLWDAKLKSDLEWQIGRECGIRFCRPKMRIVSIGAMAQSRQQDLKNIRMRQAFVAWCSAD
jgi:hypothetical protein